MTRVHLYVGAVVAVAAGLSGLLGETAGWRLDRPWLLLVVAALIALENVRSIVVPRRRHAESLSHEEALVVFMALVLAPVDALAAFALGALVGEAVTRRGWTKGVFNLAQMVAAAALAFLVVELVAPGGEGTLLRLVVAALAAVVVWSLANRAAVAGILALVGARRFHEGILDLFRSLALGWVGTVSVGVLAGVASREHPAAVPFALAVTVGVSMAFAGLARARQERQASTELVAATVAALVSIDRDGLVRTWNPEMERLTGVTADAAAGRPLAEAFRCRRADGTELDLLGPGALDDPAGREVVKVESGDGERWLLLGRAALPDGHAFVAQDVSEQRAAEQAVRDSESRLRLALEAGRMGWWEWDVATGRTHWSESLERLNGFEPGTFGGTLDAFLETIHPDDRDRIAGLAAGPVGGPSDAVFRIVRPDGAVRWIEDMGTVVHDDEGRPVKMIGVQRDITGQKRAEALASLQRRVLERIAAGGDLETVLAHVVELVEEQSANLVGSILLLDETEGRLRRVAAPSLPPTFTDLLDGLEIARNVGPGGGVHSRETVVVADIAAHPLWAGHREAALAHGLRACWSTPLVGSQGDVLGTLALYAREPGVPTDADLELAGVAGHLARIAIERHRQEGRLAAAEDRYRRLVEQLPFAVYAFTPADSREPFRAASSYVSPQIEAMLGYTAAEWSGDPELFSALVHPDDAERVRAEVEAARATAPTYRGEYRMIAKDGRTVWVHDESVYLRDANGKVVAVEGILLDISDRKALETNLAQAQKMEAVGQLAGGIAHDFNNLMGAVMGFGELVLEKLDEGDDTRPQVEQMVRAGARASEMTNQLLAFSRKQILQPRVLDLNVVVRDSQKLLERLLGEWVSLTCDLDPRLSPVLADPVQLEQVIVNLAVNARDAMPRGGKLVLQTANVEIGDDAAPDGPDLEPGQYVLLSATDTGIGMTPETQARIFEPFFTTKPDGRGTGLGLATVFGIVKQSGGDISVTSEPGQGTTFRVYLPRAARVAERPPRRPDAPVLARGSEVVLLVEDETLVRDLERHVLDECGYTVLEATGALEALELAASYEGEIDLLLTDVVMPELSGRELVERLAVVRPRMKILYVSGYSEDAIVRHGVSEANVAFLTKPFSLAALAAKVREVLDAPTAPTAATWLSDVG